MKRGIVVLMCMLLLFAAGCSEPSGTVEESIDGGVVRILPDKTELVFKARSLDMIYTNFSIDGTSAFGFEMEDVDKTREELGFNPFRIEDLKKMGVDTTREIGLAIASLEMTLDPDQTPAGDFLLFIPVTDGEKVIEKIKEMIRKESSESEISEDQGIISVSFKGEDDLSMGMMKKEDFVFIALTHKKSALDLLNSLEGNALSGSPSYKDVASEVDSTQSLFLYANMGKIVEKNKEAIANLLKSAEAEADALGNPISNIVELASGYTSIGISWDFEGPDLIMNDKRNFKKESNVARLFSSVDIDKDSVLGFKDNPVFLISGGVDWLEYYNQVMQSSDAEKAALIKGQLDALKESAGIDIVADLIENLDGSLNAGIFDGASVTMMNYNALLTLNVKDEKKAKDLIEKAISLMPEEKKGMIQKQRIDDVDTHVINAGFFQAYAGLNGKVFTLALGKPTYEKALSRDVSNGFISKIEDAQLSEALKSDGNCFYMDFSELLKIYNNFSPILAGHPNALNAKQIEMFKNFKYFLLSNTMRETSDSNLYVFKTNFTQPFFISLKDIVHSFQPKG